MGPLCKTEMALWLPSSPALVPVTLPVTHTHIRTCAYTLGLCLGASHMAPASQKSEEQGQKVMEMMWVPVGGPAAEHVLQSWVLYAKCQCLESGC